MRGKLDKLRLAVELPWITPAGAGKTFNGYGNIESAEDHPRRCGENFLRLFRIAIITGSPPQVRGKLGGAYVRLISTRITPAGAGKTAGEGLIYDKR